MKKRRTTTTTTTRKPGSAAARVAAIEAAADKVAQDIAAAAEDAGQNSLLGVPAGYKPPVPAGYKPSKKGDPFSIKAKGSPQVGVKGYTGNQWIARYHSGDDWQIIANMPSDQIYALQQQMVMIGALKKKAFQPGAADSATRNAFKGLLGQANATGQAWTQVLNQRVALADETGFDAGASADKTLPTRKITNPEDIKAVFNKASSDMVGRKLTDAELNSFVGAYQQKELESQNAAIGDAAGGGGGTVTDSPSLEAFTANHLQEGAFKPEFQATQIGENARKIMQTFTNGVQAG
jgi:hypothetical protein